MQPPDPLHAAVAALDAQLFDAFNHCSDPARLAAYTEWHATDVEFYHDEGGVTWNRGDMVANTRRFVCDKFRREVYPVKGFGDRAGLAPLLPVRLGACEGMAEFTMVWREQSGQWKVTRVLSYGHRPTAAGEGDRR